MQSSNKLNDVITDEMLKDAAVPGIFIEKIQGMQYVAGFASGGYRKIIVYVTKKNNDMPNSLFNIEIEQRVMNINN